jgi:hypothetical protein
VANDVTTNLGIFLNFTAKTWRFPKSGANPTILSYNASAVKDYNAKRSLVGFKNRNIYFYFEKKTL